MQSPLRRFEVFVDCKFAALVEQQRFYPLPNRRITDLSTVNFTV